jgi:hypothetical protein
MHQHVQQHSWQPTQQQPARAARPDLSLLLVQGLLLHQQRSGSSSSRGPV